MTVYIAAPPIARMMFDAGPAAAEQGQNDATHGVDVRNRIHCDPAHHARRWIAEPLRRKAVRVLVHDNGENEYGQSENPLQYVLGSHGPFLSVCGAYRTFSSLWH
jgi:hypothetical protein